MVVKKPFKPFNNIDLTRAQVTLISPPGLSGVSSWLSIQFSRAFNSVNSNVRGHKRCCLPKDHDAAILLCDALQLKFRSPKCIPWGNSCLTNIPVTKPWGQPSDHHHMDSSTAPVQCQRKVCGWAETVWCSEPHCEVIRELQTERELFVECWSSWCSVKSKNSEIRMVCKEQLN